MHSSKIIHFTLVINLALAIFLLVATAGCGQESQKITGEVLSESGTALYGAEVTACYSGWGWSSGQLVWDKDFCSETVLTDEMGRFVIRFNGPDYMRLRAKKEGWIQTEDFKATDSRIVLVSNEKRSARLVAERQQQERVFQQQLPGESAESYYCRVILKTSRHIGLNYRDSTLSIIPTLLKFAGHDEALFALQGAPPGNAQSFSTEVMFRIDGKTIDSNATLRLAESGCGTDLHFIQINIPQQLFDENKRVEILIPSVGAMMDIQIWKPLPAL
ncbi:MAG: carboxypeptidase-like regulatory domain-containing protein [Desulfuromonadales bacterium]|nr:carboxypeptidase-like regulatory domain-containing protein [Desulfuromonadales bacterium]